MRQLLPIYAIQATITALCLVAVRAGLPLDRMFSKRVAGVYHWIAERRGLAFLLPPCVLVVVRLAFLPWFPIPEPQFHDEMSLLLGAKTFAMGRLTNPTHPMWSHFETFHVLQRPTYTTIYPPAQSAMLALGILVGHPWIAVLGSAAAMCGIFVWMLRVWFPAGWALLGGLLLVGRIGYFSYWTNSYWGGTLAAIAGAILVGAAGRILFRKRIQVHLACLLALGFAILINRRPFEGSLMTVGVGIWLAHGLWRVWEQPAWTKVLRLAIVAGAITLPGVLVTGFYSLRVTGSPVVMAYMLQIRQLHIAPHLLWMKPSPEPVYANTQFRKFFRSEYTYFEDRLNHPISTTAVVLFRLYCFFIGPSLTIALVALPFVLRQTKLRPILLILTGVSVVNLTETWLVPHYVAPELPLGWILIVACLVSLAGWRPPWGRRLVGTAVIGCLLIEPAADAVMLIHRRNVLSFATPREAAVMTGKGALCYLCAPPWERPGVTKMISAIPGKHLVLVSYLQGHVPDDEWVYNDPDIDASRIVWARSLGVHEDGALLNYFSGRHIWELEIGAGVHSLRQIDEPTTGAFVP